MLLARDHWHVNKAHAWTLLRSIGLDLLPNSCSELMVQTVQNMVLIQCQGSWEDGHR
jgi:hypothetical protein